ncbi:MAG: SecDF P1 head subdomain-containing protein [Planctomycetota bacterium]|jgi:preprotein translocase subunit SecD
MAIVLDDQVHAAPVLQSTLTGTGQISGGYTEEEARNLAALLGSESLPVRLARVR